MSLFLSCGEASGDLHAAGLVAELRKKAPDLTCWGLIGPQAEGAGAELFRPSSELELFGLTEVLPSLARLWRLRSTLIEEVRRRRPRCVVTVDSPDFNLPLAKGLRRSGYEGPIVNIAPPTLWAWRPGRAKILRACKILCLPLFGFEDRLLTELGLVSRWRGHPLLDVYRHWHPDGALDPLFPASFLALLPGSRWSEIERLMPVMAEVADSLAEGGRESVFSVAPGLAPDVRRRLLRLLEGRKFYEGPARELLSRSQAAVVASGTITVEALLLDRFAVVGYRISSPSWLLGRWLCPVEHVAIPNIMAGEELYPELLQSRWTTSAVLGCLSRYEGEAPYREALHEKMATIGRRELGREGALSLWAETVLEVLGR